MLYPFFFFSFSGHKAENLSILFEVITIYSPVVCLKFDLPTCCFIFDILPIYGSFCKCSVIHVIHLKIFHYSNTFYPKIRQEIKSNTLLPLSLSHLLIHSKLRINWVLFVQRHRGSRPMDSCLGTKTSDLHRSRAWTALSSHWAKAYYYPPWRADE